MRHKIGYRKLNRTSEHRKALFKNMLNSLIKYEQITTTLPKAKELKPKIDKVITLGKRNDLKSKKNLINALTIETTILDFKISNTFEQYESYMNAKEQQSMFKEMGVKTSYIGKSLDDPQRATVIFQGPENVLYDIFMNPETKPIVEASGHIYAGTKITRWIS